MFHRVGLSIAAALGLLLAGSVSVANPPAGKGGGGGGGGAKGGAGHGGKAPAPAAKGAAKEKAAKGTTSHATDKHHHTVKDPTHKVTTVPATRHAAPVKTTDRNVVRESRGAQWVVSYRENATGPLHRRTFKNQESADRWLQEFKTKHPLGEGTISTQ